MQTPLPAQRSPQRRRQRGLTSVEYAVAGGLIIVVVVLAFTPFGSALKAAFDSMIALF